MVLADGEDHGLERLIIKAAVPCRKPRAQVLDGLAFKIGRQAEHPGGRDLVGKVAHGKACGGVKIGVAFGRGIGRIALDEPPKPLGVLGPGYGGKVQQHRERHHHF